MNNLFQLIITKLKTAPFSKWLYRLFPNPNTIKVKSGIEMIIYFLIFIYCIHLYKAWNRVIVHEERIEFDCISYNPSWFSTGRDNSKDWKPIANIVYSINMSNAVKQTHDTIQSYCELNDWRISRNHEERSHGKNGGYSRDSVILSSDYWTYVSERSNCWKSDALSPDSIMDSLWRKYINSDSSIMFPYYFHYQIKNRQDTLVSILNSKDTCDYRTKGNYLNLYHLFHYRFSSRINGSYKDFENKPYIAYGIDGRTRDTICTQIMSWGINNNYLYDDYFVIQTKQTDPYSFYKYRVGKGENPKVAPKFYSKYDITQAYYNFDLSCFNVDSVVFRIDFIGVCDFSAMNPSPDIIDESSITFSDPLKISKIKKDGLKFHAHFKEMDNIQTVRLFAITTILTALSTVFLGYLVVITSLGLLKCLRRKKELKKESEDAECEKKEEKKIETKETLGDNPEDCKVDKSKKKKKMQEKNARKNARKKCKKKMIVF